MNKGAIANSSESVNSMAPFIYHYYSSYLLRTLLSNNIKHTHLSF